MVRNANHKLVPAHLAVSVLHLYGTGWLGKSFCSDGIHFYGAPQHVFSKEDALLLMVCACSSDSHDSQGNTEDFRHASLKAANARHPQHHTPSNSLFFRLVHDFGIVLLEIGLGRSLVSYQAVPSGDGHEVWKGIKKMVEATHLGRKYKSLILDCVGFELGFERPEKAFLSHIIGQ